MVRSPRKMPPMPIESAFVSAPSCFEVQRAIMPAVSRRSGPMSCRAIVVPCSSGKLRVSVRRFLVKTTLPAPIKAIFKVPSLLWKSVEQVPQGQLVDSVRMHHVRVELEYVAGRALGALRLEAARDLTFRVHLQEAVH